MLIGRRGNLTPGAAEAVSDLEALGARVKVVACDITDRAAVRSMLRDIRPDCPPISGILHAAMVLDDVLIANLAISAPTTPAAEVTNSEWGNVFNALVHPLPRLVRAVLPQMMARASGKIIVIGSASALRGMKLTSTYSAARGAQIAYVQALGVEVAKHNIQVNAIAQNFVDNPSYFPEEIQANPKFQDRLKREVPLGRLVSASEDASFVAYLCSEAANCFVGQVFPVCGGWIPR